MMYVACFFVGGIFGMITISIFAAGRIVEAEGIVDRLRAEIKTLKQHMRWEK